MQMADEHERLSPAAGTAESEVRTTKQQPDPQDGRSQSEVVWEKEKKDFQLRIEHLTDALESARSLGRKQGARIEELEREAQRKQSLLEESKESHREARAAKEPEVAIH